MRVAIAGGSGMIGTALAQALTARGDDVLLLTRRPPRNSSEVRWDPVKGTLDLAKLNGLDAVFHLAGAPIADRPWTRSRRKVLIESRVDTARALVNSLSKLDRPPKAFLGAGHLGRFGSRGEELIDDDSPAGTGFLSELSVAWEDALLGAHVLGARPVVLRMGIVLSATGGAFPLIVKPFRIGLGGRLGDGRQFIPWMTIRDTVGAFLHLLDRPDCRGAYNASVPDPVRNKEWSRAFGRALHRPVIAHAPKWALRGALGELADDFFLASMRVVPRRLLESGYRFLDVEPEAAVEWLVAELDRP